MHYGNRNRQNNSSGSRNGRFSSSRGYRRPFNKSQRKRQPEWSATELIQTITAAKQKVTDVATENVYQAQNTFTGFNLEPQIKYNISQRGYKTPSSIQDQAIPHLLEGRDLIGLANTGTGKTASFLIPLINKVFKDKTQKVLIIAPTRELAEQIYVDFRALSQGTGIYAALIIGGANIHKQLGQLRKGSEFVIATPGRLKDIINRKAINLETFSNVVLDETDRMVDIGFVNEIKYFIGLLPQKRQSLFFSATINPRVKEILISFVQNPVTVDVRQQKTNANIAQDIVQVSGRQKKIEVLHDLLINEEFKRVIIFGNTKWAIQKLSDELSNRGFKADAIHGNKRQSQRRRTLERFKKNDIQILLATDVASRGLDINDVSHVINYELPASYDDYVHRIGRTGRANKKGTALTFVEAL